MHMDSSALGYIVVPLYTHTSFLNFVFVFTQTSYHGFSKWLKSPDVKESKRVLDSEYHGLDSG